MLWVWLSKVRGSTGRCLRHLSPPPRSWAPHMGEVAHSEVSSMSNVRDSNCPPAEGSAPSPLFPNCINESKVRGDIGRSMVLLQVVGVTQINLVFR